MKMIDRLRKQMEAIGGSLDEYDNFFCLDAPPGYVWKLNGTPTVTIHFANNFGQTWLLKAIKMERETISAGLRLATPDEMEKIRHNNDDDGWAAPHGSPEVITLI